MFASVSRAIEARVFAREVLLVGLSLQVNHNLSKCHRRSVNVKNTSRLKEDYIEISLKRVILGEEGCGSKVYH